MQYVICDGESRGQACYPAITLMNSCGPTSAHLGVRSIPNYTDRFLIPWM